VADDFATVVVRPKLPRPPGSVILVVDGSAALHSGRGFSDGASHSLPSAGVYSLIVTDPYILLRDILFKIRQFVSSLSSHIICIH
jgi:hypothetical protein